MTESPLLIIKTTGLSDSEVQRQWWSDSFHADKSIRTEIPSRNRGNAI